MGENGTAGTGRHQKCYGLRKGQGKLGRQVMHGCRAPQGQACFGEAEDPESDQEKQTSPPFLRMARWSTSMDMLLPA